MKESFHLTGLAGRLQALNRWERRAQGAKPDSHLVPSGGKEHPEVCLPSTATLARVSPSKTSAKMPERPQVVLQGR